MHGIEGQGKAAKRVKQGQEHGSRDVELWVRWDGAKVVHPQISWGSFAIPLIGTSTDRCNNIKYK